jgi:hypothetical protein
MLRFAKKLKSEGRGGLSLQHWFCGICGGSETSAAPCTWLRRSVTEGFGVIGGGRASSTCLIIGLSSIHVTITSQVATLTRPHQRIKDRV